MLKLHVLASGSKGNAAIVEDAASGAGVLIDCGICKRDFFARCDEVGFATGNLAAIVITHEHTDHTKGLGVVYRGLKKAGVTPVVYTSRLIARGSSAVRELIEREGAPFVAFEEADGGAGSGDGAVGAAGTKSDDSPTGAAEMLPFEFASLRVMPFRTSHDALDSFGFRFEGPDGDVIGYMTDTGYVTDAAFAALRDVRILALESNHDAKMLATGDYPWHLKQRVGSERGHLSNDQAAEALTRLLGPRLETVVAMHVSQNNNTYRLPVEVLTAAVEAAGYGGKVEVLTSWQDRVLAVE